MPERNNFGGVTTNTEMDDYQKGRLIELIQHQKDLPMKNVEKILAVTKIGECLAFIVEWDPFPSYERDISLVAANVMNQIAPNEVIKFYEEHLKFLQSTAGLPN